MTLQDARNNQAREEQIKAYIKDLRGVENTLDIKIIRVDTSDYLRGLPRVSVTYKVGEELFENLICDRDICAGVCPRYEAINIFDRGDK